MLGLWNTQKMALALALLGIWTACAHDDDLSKAPFDPDTLFDLSLEELMDIDVIPAAQPSLHSQALSVHPGIADRPIIIAARKRREITAEAENGLRPFSIQLETTLFAPLIRQHHELTSGYRG